MKTNAAIEFFGSGRALAEGLGIKPAAVYQWGEYPPHLRQLQIELLTGGELKAENAAKLQQGNEKGVKYEPRRKRA